MKKTLKVFLVGVWAMISLNTFSLQAQDIEGIWKTIDDETGEAKSHVQIYKTTSGKYAGKVIKILRESHVNDVCSKCSDYRKDKPIQGMIILVGLEKDDDEWTGGKILDPQKGKEYKCTLTLENKDRLKVRGYIGIEAIGRSQIWQRVN